MIDNAEYITDERLNELARIAEHYAEDGRHSSLWHGVRSALKDLRERREKERRLVTEVANAPYRHFQATLCEDQSYANVWHDNIACNALDAGVGHDTANDIASRVMKHCFDVETKRPAERGGVDLLGVLEKTPLAPVPEQRPALPNPFDPATKRTPLE